MPRMPSGLAPKQSYILSNGSGHNSMESTSGGSLDDPEAALRRTSSFPDRERSYSYSPQGNNSEGDDDCDSVQQEQEQQQRTPRGRRRASLSTAPGAYRRSPSRGGSPTQPCDSNGPSTYVAPMGMGSPAVTAPAKAGGGPRQPSRATHSRRSTSDSTPLLRRRMRFFERGSSGGGDSVLPHHTSSSAPSSGFTFNRSRNNSYHGHHHGSGGGSFVSIPLGYLLHILFFFTVIYILVDSKSKVDSATEQLLWYQTQDLKVTNRMEDLETKAMNLQHEVSQLRQTNVQLGKKRDAVKNRLENGGDGGDGGITDDVEQQKRALLDRDSAVSEQVLNLQEKVQAEAERQVIEKFGQGPYKVELLLDLEGSPASNRIHVELAPLGLMPHAIQTFLEQVSEKLWDGCAFVWNPQHLVLATTHVKVADGVRGESPQSREARQHQANEERRQKFVESGFSSLSFPEYSEEYPHKVWTIGFAGKPRPGPNFYINLKDNTAVHGPTVQNNGEADPCFGKVVAGFDVLARMMKRPKSSKKEGWAKDAYEQAITIQHAKII